MKKETTTGHTVLIDYLLIGGGVAAASTAETLRNEGEKGTIAIQCAESGYSYDRPPLTGSIVTGEMAPTRALIRPPGAYEHDGIEVRLNSAVRAVRPKRHLAIDQNAAVYRFRELLAVEPTFCAGPTDVERSIARPNDPLGQVLETHGGIKTIMSEEHSK